MIENQGRRAEIERQCPIQAPYSWLLFVWCAILLILFDIICVTSVSLKGNGCRQFNGVQIDGMQIQKCNTEDCHTKLVIKPSSENGYWKVICEPKERDLRILTKKIPIGSLLHFQVFLSSMLLVRLYIFSDSLVSVVKYIKFVGYVSNNTWHFHRFRVFIYLALCACNGRFRFLCI